MSLETATYISDLDTANPAGGDPRATADDHLRLIKAAVKRTFANVTGAVLVTHTELNRVAGLSSTAQDQINTLITGKLNISATALTAVSALYAQSASYAASAGAASHAQSANGALSAVFATSATNATNAVAAQSAVVANSAIYADNAESAVYAYSATNANHAASAGAAVNASLANSAIWALSANYALSAAYAAEAGDYNNAISVGQVDSASAGGRGLVELATSAEVSAGSSTDLAVTPAGLLAGLGVSKADPGWVRLPSGLIIQWGTTASVSSGDDAWVQSTATFPLPFPTALLSAVVGLHMSAVPAANRAFTLFDPGGSSTTTLSAYIQRDQAAGTFQCTYIAIGY